MFSILNDISGWISRKEPVYRPVPPTRKSAILSRIHAALERDTRINLHGFPIALSFDGEDLVLAAEVEHIAAKKIALELSAAAAPGLRIVDRLRVKPANRMSDGEIRDHVVKLLLAEPTLERCLIHSRLPDRLTTHRKLILEANCTIVVRVDGGVVTLNGEVPSLAHKRLAGLLAWWVPGSRDVINGLEEVPSEADSDDELTDAVRLALEKDPFVNASKIQVESESATVTLAGLVPRLTMKQMAESDAWYVFGVRAVVNNLHTE